MADVALSDDIQFPDLTAALATGDEKLVGVLGVDPDFENFKMSLDEIGIFVRGYKSYAFNITQAGTADPTVTVLKNDLGGAVVWSRSNSGRFLATLIGAFPSPVLNQGFIGQVLGMQLKLSRSSSAAFFLEQKDLAGTYTDVITDIPGEIRVYF